MVAIGTIALPIVLAVMGVIVALKPPATETIQWIWMNHSGDWGLSISGTSSLAIRSVLFSARAQAHGMSSSMRDAGHRLTSFDRTSCPVHALPAYISPRRRAAWRENQLSAMEMASKHAQFRHASG
jgi:hypothetical protein